MTRELRAQERVPCALPSNGECDPRPSFQCDGCAYDGTRWATVGALVDVEMRVNAEEPEIARPVYEDEAVDYDTAPLFALIEEPS